MRQFKTRGAIGLLFGAGLFLASSGASASSDPRWLACTTPGGAPSVVMANCNAFLQTGGGAAMDRATAFYYRGNARFGQQDYAGALADYTDAIRINPSYAKAFNNAGYALSKLGHYAHAIPNYTAAINLDPRYTQALLNRGDAYAHLQDYAHAAEDYGRAIQLDPANTNAYFNRGVAHYRSAQFGKAIADYDVVLARNPNDPDARSNRALAQQQLDRITAEQNAAQAAAISNAVTAFANQITSQQNANHPYGGTGSSQAASGNLDLENCVTSLGQRFTPAAAPDSNGADGWSVRFQNTCPGTFGIHARTSTGKVEGDTIYPARNSATTAVVTCSARTHCTGFVEWWVTRGGVPSSHHPIH